MSGVHDFPTAQLRLPAIRTGSAWEWEIDLAIRDDDSGEAEALDLTGAEARLQLRRHPADTIAFVSVSHLDGIAIDGPTIAVELSSAQTAGLSAQQCLQWDLQIKMPGGDWWTPVAGEVQIVRGISRDE